MRVSLRDVILAVRYGDAALVGESAGYLILGAADRATKRPQQASLDAITLSEEGVVELEGVASSAEEAETSLRILLGHLLEHVRAPCINLQRVVAREDIRGLSGLVSELEASLIPVNRRAAARSLARLVREARRSAAQERSFARVEAVARPPHVLQESYPGENVFESPDAMIAPPAPLASVHPAVTELPVAAKSSTEERVISARLVGVQVLSALNSAPRVPENAGSIMMGGGAAVPLKLSAEYCEPDVFLDDEFDEAPTQILTGASLLRVEVVDDKTTGIGVPTASSSDMPTGENVWRVPVEPSQPKKPDELSARLAALSASISHSDLVSTVPALVVPERPRLAPLPVPIEPPKARSARRAPPKIRFLQAGRRVRREFSEHESLIPLDARAPIRRSSQISELLDRMQISIHPADELYLGLKNLARVDHSPTPPSIVEGPSVQSAV